MNKKETAVIIDGKAQDLTQWFVSNKEKGLQYTGFDTVETLGFVLSDLLGVCATALHAISDNDHLPARKQQQVLGACSLDIANVLRFAISIIPNTELELLGNIHTSILENAKG